MRLIISPLHKLGLSVLSIILCFACDPQNTEPSIKPEPTRFSYELLAEGLEEPIQLDFDEKGRVYWIERTGSVKRLDEELAQISIIGRVALATEDAPGLVGLLVDKDFGHTRQIFLYFSAAEDKGEYMRLSRFDLDEEGRLDTGSEVVVLKIFWEQPDGQHFGGGMTWDQDGNLILSVGCDTAPSQYAPLAFTNEGGRGQDSGRSAGNSNDLRGAILRVKPNPDGTYSIPDGNLFPPGTPNTKPEIYAMGNRNPWRVSIDSKTGYLHWGEVGPDAGMDSERLGPMGYDEFNVAKGPGNFGWPFFIGDNLPYSSYDYSEETYGEPFDPDNPVNRSPNNTGIKELPAAQPSMVSYPYRVDENWPILGSAARSAVGGPVFRQADFSDELGKHIFPSYYEGKWLVTDYVRNWIMVLTMDRERSKVLHIEPLLPQDLLQHKQPLDMDFGPSGDLYIVEYGISGQGKISKIIYNGGNRPPIAKASAIAGYQNDPLSVRLSAEGSVDYDGSELNYNWTITGMGQEVFFDSPNPIWKADSEGLYTVTLKVSDPEALSDTTVLELVVGNQPPVVNFDIIKGNQTFFFPDEMIDFRVQISDGEDPDISQGSLSVTAEYIPSGITIGQLNQLREENLLKPGVPVSHLKAETLMENFNCLSCHRKEEKLVGPSYREVSRKYMRIANADEILIKSIAEGSTGQWGDAHMPPHPMIPDNELAQLSAYILSLEGDEMPLTQLESSGSFKLTPRELTRPVDRLGKFYKFDIEPGAYLFFSQYEDQGIEGVPGLNLTGQDIRLLRYPLFPPESADEFSSEGISFTPSTDDPGFIITGKGGYLGFYQVDLTDIHTIRVGAITRFWHWSHFIGGTLEVRLGSPSGDLVGSPKEILPIPTKDGDGPFFGEASGKPTSVDVSDIQGLQDIYIRISNDSSRESDALVIITGIEFLYQ
ncbi:MAG TPA: PQQ-dependent sugar dehydrogenase [Lunatimonas sp.]|nr:PQQ-dependent sugar dehydrogenase [Lunatimonas sp.]